MELLLGLMLVIIIVLTVFTWQLDRQSQIIRQYLLAARGERDQARNELIQVRAEHDSLLQTVNEGLVLVDSSEQIQWLNDAARKILNLPKEKNYALDEIAWWLDLQPLLRDVLAHHAESLGQTVVKNERAFQVNVQAFPIPSHYAAIISIREVTELQRLGRVRRDFVANISHELRTPVTTIQLLVDTLARELPANLPGATDLLGKLREQVGVLNQLAEEMMGLALIESGQMPIRLIETHVIDLVEGTLEVLRTQAEHKGIQIEVQISSELCALADATGVRKVLNNLLHNAIKFTPARGRVHLSAVAVDDNIQIEISDTGCGIPARDLARIFERFYKVDQSRASSGTRGTGLGLAIAKHIVEGHGGKIWAESIEGQGSTFYFTLPACGDLSSPGL